VEVEKVPTNGAIDAGDRVAVALRLDRIATFSQA
jgi:hypothetical protein